MSFGRVLKARALRSTSCSKIWKLPLMSPLAARGLSRRPPSPSMPDLGELVADPRRAFQLSAVEAAALLIELASLQAAIAARLTAGSAVVPGNSSGSES